jgi:hypothetical protein
LRLPNRRPVSISGIFRVLYNKEYFMRLNYWIGAALVLALAAVSAPCLPRGGFAGGAGLSAGAFTGDDGLYPMAGFTLSAGWAFPAGPGTALLGFETGYTSAFSTNGGPFGMTPLALAASYALPLEASPVSLEGGSGAGQSPCSRCGSRAGAERGSS